MALVCIVSASEQSRLSCVSLGAESGKRFQRTKIGKWKLIIQSHDDSLKSVKIPLMVSLFQCGLHCLSVMKVKLH